MSLLALSEYTVVSKYSRYNKEAGRRETFDEAVGRVEDMHLEKYATNLFQTGISEDILWAFEQVRQKRVLGSQRALQFGGQPVLSKNARLYNCTVSFCDRARFFQEAFWLLLCGAGVGFSVQKHHVAKLPEIHQIDVQDYFTHVAEDSIEGWADCLGVLLSCFMYNPDMPDNFGKYVRWDFSNIRPKGSPVSSGVGKAPGFEPLEKALYRIYDVLRDAAAAGNRMSPIVAYDIVMHASDAVLSGGVRRSATICLFSPDDEEMINAKVGNWQKENPQRGRSNNSALLLRDGTPKEQFDKLMYAVREFGEPGFVWADSTELLVNPCVEIGMWPVHAETGESGWQMCNLCEINGAKVKTVEDFEIAARAAAIIGTLQAGYTSFPYLGKVSEEIVRREALLGVSITGMMDNPDILFDAETQKRVAQLIKDVNKEIACKIGVNQAARTTCVKPAGTTSCILGSASGIHPHHAKRYLRRVQANELEAPLRHFKQFNPRAVEKSHWSANETDEIITFCIEVPAGAKTKNDLGAIEMLEMVKLTKENWVDAGKNEDLCVQPWLSHNVSNTITVKKDEWETVGDYIFENKNNFAGISLIPESGDLDYKQAPNVAIRTAHEIVTRYGPGAMMASGLIVDGNHVFDDDLWKACDAIVGYATVDTSEQKVWIERAKQFADRYFEGNIRLMTYCLKDVNNLKLWEDLRREHAEVDFSLMLEDTDETKPSEDIACGGGSCEIFAPTPALAKSA